MVTGVLADTVDVVTGKVVLVAFDGIVTKGGTVATEVVPEASVTKAPPIGARPLRVTVAVALPDPPTTSAGDKVMELIWGGVSTRLAEADEVPRMAVTEADVWLVTTLVLILNVVVVRPELTVTEDGTETDVLLSESVTRVPEDGAGPVRVMVPTDVFPPDSVEGLTVKEDRAGGFTVSEALTLPL